MARLKTLHPNGRAFLDTLAWCEGTSTAHHTGDDGYDIIVTSVTADGTRKMFNRLEDYSKHPFDLGEPKWKSGLKINTKGLYSTASGRYQHIIKTWWDCRRVLGLRDFSPESQDRAAWWLIQKCKADLLIEAGLIEDAIKLVSKVWASLPGANYKDQKMRPMLQCVAMFETKGGTLWNSSQVASGVTSLPELQQSLRS